MRILHHLRAVTLGMLTALVAALSSETSVRVAGKWAYLYRAVDSAGDTIDFMLSPKRDLTAAKLFLRLALSGTGGIRPRVINVDGHRRMLALSPS